MWKEQTGKIVDTEISGTGLISDYWKYVRNELQKSEIVVPIKIQYFIDKLADNKAIVIDKERYYSKKYK